MMVRIRKLLTVRGLLFTAAALALLVAAVSFAYSLQQTHALAAHDRAIIAAEVAEARRHCLSDAAQDNRRRALDLALIVADRETLARLRALPFTGPGDHAMHRALVAYYQAALAARLVDIPSYVSAASCG